MTTTSILITAAVLIAVYLYFKPKSDGSSYSDVSVSDLGPLMKDKNTVLLDVRTRREISQGKIGKPIEIELGPSMKQKLSSLDKNKKYIVYCRSGRRSIMASNMMTSMGFIDVNNLLGGYIAWGQK